jgi:hypothetical protein
LWYGMECFEVCTFILSFCFYIEISDVDSHQMLNF